MRKKLFAVIMSAMMMVTFMPAMAFAYGPAPTPSKITGWYVDGVAVKDTAGDPAYTDSGIYDGKEHTVAFDFAAGTEGTVTAYQVRNDDTKTWIAKNATSVALKDAATYTIFVEGKYWDEANHTYSPLTVHEFTLIINKRPVVLSAKNSTTTILKEKNYDGKGFVLSDADFSITPKWDTTKKDYVDANSGLVAGDTLFTKAVETPADAGVYEVASLTWKNVNPNYAAFTEYGNHQLMPWIQTKGATVVILKADNAVTLSKTNKTFNVAGKQTTAKKTFKINPKATWGTVKVTKVGGSGYLYLKGNKVVVKKGAKLGTYKLKVKAYVVGNSNYASAEMIKTINVKIK